MSGVRGGREASEDGRDEREVGGWGVGGEKLRESERGSDGH